MTITGIILRVGEARTFTKDGGSYGSREGKAVEMEIQSGVNTFVGEAYDNVADEAIKQLAKGDAVVMEAVFSLRNAKRQDGSTFANQRVSFTAFQKLNQNQVF